MEIKEKAVKYFDLHHDRYFEDYYKRDKFHPKWVRHKKILEIIEDRKLSDNSKIADIGCGPGLLARDLSKMGFKGAGLDSSNNMINTAVDIFKDVGDENKWRFQVGDAENTPFKDNEFNVVVASGLIEYMDEDEKLLRELNRITLIDGLLIINIVNSWGYATCLNDLTKYLKKIPGVMTALSRIRRAILSSEYGADDLGFTPRKHNFWKFKKLCQSNGFTLENNYCHHFSFFPAPLSTLTNPFLARIESNLDILGKTPLKIFCGTNLLVLRKTCEI